EADFPRGGPPEITVLAEDALQRLRLARRSKTYENVSIADIANQIAQAAGIQANVDGFEDTSGVYVQMNESDLAFLRRLLARYDGDLQIVGDELHIAPRGNVRRAELTLQLHAELRAVRVLADLAQQTTEVTVSGWDVAQGEAINVSSSGVDLGPGQGEDGATVLRDTLGERAEHVGHLAAATQAEAQAIADSAFDQRARRFLVLEGTTEGNPQLRVGAHVEIGGLGPRFSNTYYVTRVCHRYDLVNGYETDFEGGCGYWGRD
ncbi:MAG: phage late control D family protein, partial [Caldilineaceae bacterium]|nr:phage late control D family protein [Caldilineaceae bacterium]